MSVREYLNLQYSGSRSFPVWSDLWTLAATIDCELGSATSEQKVLALLATDDILEMSLRRLSSYV